MVIIESLLSLGGLLMPFAFLMLALSLRSSKDNAVKLNNLLFGNWKVFSLILAFAAIIFSFYYSFVVGYNPCKLCWYQRYVLYFIFFVLLVFIKKPIRKVVMVLAMIGVMIASYQYITQMLTYNGIQLTEICSVNGVSCSIPNFVSFGFVTIPLMSLFTFLFILLFGYNGHVRTK